MAAPGRDAGWGMAAEAVMTTIVRALAGADPERWGPDRALGMATPPRRAPSANAHGDYRQSRKRVA